MKIGILTHHYINNFGAFLQAYALQEAVSQLCPDDDVYIINCINLKHFIINVGGWFRFYKNKETFAAWVQKTRIPMTFNKARKKNMRLTTKCYTTKKVESIKFDCIIVGSDEVWNYCESKANSKIKFGVGLTCPKMIAYAPSVGQTDINDIPEYVESGIQRFSAVSARDDITESMVRKIRNEKICRVVDPTFLTNIPTEPIAGINNPFILFYYCDGLDDVEKQKIFEYANKNGLDVYGAGECDKRYTANTVNLTPFQWVWMFKNASYVVTGTFHGAVFSMLNYRQFACYLTNPSRIKKVGSLIKEFGLENRQIEGKASDIIKVLETDIDYDAVKQLFETKQKNSLKYLESAING